MEVVLFISKDGSYTCLEKMPFTLIVPSKLNTISLLCTESPILHLMYCKDVSRKVIFVTCFLYIFHISFQIQCFILPSCLIAENTVNSSL